MAVRRPPWLVIFAALIGAVLLLPGLIVFPMSLNGRRSLGFPPDEWGTEWYKRFFENPDWAGAMLNSLQTAVIVAVLATLIGTMAAFGLVRHDFRGKKLVIGLVLAPMITPIVIVGVADYAVFLRWQLVGSQPGFVLAHTVLAIPYVVITVSASLTGVQRHLELAAQSLGAPPHRVIAGVTMPLIAPGVAAGALLAFISSFDETVVALFLSDPNYRTLPAQMYGSVTREIDPTIAAASSMIMVLSTSLLIVSVTVFRSRYARR